MTDPSGTNRSQSTDDAPRQAAAEDITRSTSPPDAPQQSRDDRTDATSEDCTPYAASIAGGSARRWTMTKWVMTATRQRLQHLELLRVSRASRRFARGSGMLFCAAVTVAAFANLGWRVVETGPGVFASAQAPTGKGWGQVLSADQARRTSAGGRLIPVALWWNAPRATAAACVALVLSSITYVLSLWLVGGGAERAVSAAGQGSPRLRCAVHYSTAWLAPVTLATIPLLLRPLSDMSRVAGWRFNLPTTVFDVPAVVIALVGMLMWWFWLIRLAETTPQTARSKVSRFFVMWAPLLTLSIIAASTWGGGRVIDLIAGGMKLDW